MQQRQHAGIWSSVASCNRRVLRLAGARCLQSPIASLLASTSETAGSVPPYLLMKLAVPAPEDACQAMQLVHEGVLLLDRHHAHTMRLHRTEHDTAHTINLATSRSGCRNMQAAPEVLTLTAASPPPPRAPAPQN